MKHDSENPDVKQELEGKVILVAEDIQWNFSYIQLLLGRVCHMKVLWAKDGIEAVKMCRDHPEIDLILMDIQMPELDGLRATTAIKEFRPGLPIIAHTAYAMDEERKLCLSAGCSGYISKPIRHDELVEEITLALKTKKRQS